MTSAISQKIKHIHFKNCNKDFCFKLHNPRVNSLNPLFLELDAQHDVQ